jgi:hypothetical protein
VREPVLLFMRMTPPWVFIDEIRRFVESFCACACPGQDREAHLALAVHELMQNAVSVSGVGSVELTLEVDSPADQVSVKVTNACTAAEAEALRRRIDDMYRERDALKQYLKMMAETPRDRRGGLGHARNRLEAQHDQEASYEGGRVTVRAAGKLAVPPHVAARVSHGS